MLDDVEVRLVLTDDVEEGCIFRTRFELGDEGDEEGNLELDLVGIDAVEDAVELGVVESGVEFFVGGSFGSEEFFGRIQVALFTAFGEEVVGEGSRSAGEDAVQGSADGAELGGFEGFIISGESGVEVGSAEVELFREVSGAGFAGIKDNADA